jgi:hypothetical protein
MNGKTIFQTLENDGGCQPHRRRKKNA